VILFLDGDGSDVAALMPRIVQPIFDDEQDFVIGSRTRGNRERGSMNFQQVFSGRAAGVLLKMLYGVSYTDMSPFRAIRREALERLGMKEQTYGWNLEMQMRVARAGLRILEVPVDHRCRTGGESKVSGTLRGTFVAGTRSSRPCFASPPSGDPRALHLTANRGDDGGRGHVQDSTRLLTACFEDEEVIDAFALHEVVLRDDSKPSLRGFLDHDVRIQAVIGADAVFVDDAETPAGRIASRSFRSNATGLATSWYVLRSNTASTLRGASSGSSALPSTVLMLGSFSFAARRLMWRT
jgi:hypothetical protein